MSLIKRDPVAKIEKLTNKVTEEISNFTNMLENTADNAEDAEIETKDAITRLQISLGKLAKTKNFCRKMLEFLKD